MEIKGMRYNKGHSITGFDAIDAEFQIKDNSDNKKFLHVSQNSVDEHYSVSNESIFEYMTCKSDDEEEPVFDFTENYTSLDDAYNSKFLKYFKLLEELISKINSI